MLLLEYYSRDNKIVKAEVMKKNLKVSKISSEQLSIINKIIKDETTIITDEFKGYNLVSKSTNHKHFRVNHSRSYVDENGEITLKVSFLL
jgi:hypothetical protein